MHRNLAVLGLLALLAACGSHDIEPVTVPPAPVAVPPIQPLVMNPVQWRVIAGDTPLIALDEEGYRNLTLNLIDLRRYIEEQKAVIAMLRRIMDERSQQGQPQPTQPAQASP